MSSKLKVILFATLLASTTLLHAGVSMYTNQTIFDAQGTIAYNTAFSCGTDFCFPGDPYTVGGVTYTTGANVIVGTNSFYFPVAALSAYDFWTPLPGSIETSPTHNMFGFMLGTITTSGFPSLMDVTLTTNLGNYAFNSLSNPDAASGLQFYGFIAGTGEYFTGFSIGSENGVGWAPGITNVELGTTVPEPGTLAMLGSGLTLLAGALRRKLML
jgi:hypothetical protein